jgi:alkyldihydroxyacetonephosphate synthase
LKVAEELADLLGRDAVGTMPNEAGPGPDWSPMAFVAARAGAEANPACVVRPRSTEHVVRVLTWADRKRMPIVPRGGGSGVCEAVSADVSVVVDMRAMNRVLDFDDHGRVVVVQAGVGGATLDHFLARRGHCLGHEPQSMALSTVGGWIATRASGQLSSLYGGIESLISGLEAVLPGGRVVRSKATPRRAAGPDVASLMIGSEGALGIVTEATLRVVPLPTEHAHRSVHFGGMDEGIEACRIVAQSELGPAVVRLYDEDDAALFLRNRGDGPPGPLLLLSFRGRDASGRADAGVRACGGSRGDDALVEHWWRHRNDAVDEYRRLMAGEGTLGPHALIDTMEVAATWPAIGDLYRAMKTALARTAQLAACHLSHVYPDGACLYFTLASACDGDDHARSVHAEWWEVGMRACLDAGGSISHHHGIGRVKARWLDEELGGWSGVLGSIKRVVDPHGIMNPGVLGL